MLIAGSTAAKVSLEGSPCLVLQHSPGKSSLDRATLAGAYLQVIVSVSLALMTCSSSVMLRVGGVIE